MKIASTILIAVFLGSGSIAQADTLSLPGTFDSKATAAETWTAGDHMGAAKHYEEEARLLRAEARGMEHIEMKILPFLEVEAIKEAGVQKVIDRRLKEAEENEKLAKWHQKEAINMLQMVETNMPAVMDSHKTVTTGVSQTSHSGSNQSYMKYDWIEEEAILGW